MPQINLSTSIFVPAQFPLENKRYAVTLAELQTLGTANVKAYYYYEGLKIYCVETNKTYIWRETTINEIGGLITPSFQYPASVISNGIDYSNRYFNLFEDVDANITIINQTLETIINNVFNQSLSNTILYGAVEWQENLDFFSTEFSFIFDGVNYIAPPLSSITLAPADATFPRIDVFAVSTDGGGELQVIQGTPSANPQEPVVDFATQLYVGYVLIPANATEPQDFERQLVYNENVGEPNEWTLSENTGAARINLASNTQPSVDSLHIEAAGVLNNDAITIVNDTLIDVNDIATLSLRIKTTTAEPIAINIRLDDSTSFVPQSLNTLLEDGMFGFDASNTSTYQDIIIPIAALNYQGQQFDTIIFEFRVLGVPSFTGVYIDWINLNTNNLIPQPGINTYLELTDTPNTYTGHANKVAVVNTAENGKEFVNYGLQRTLNAGDYAEGTDPNQNIEIDLENKNFYAVIDSHDVSLSNSGAVIGGDTFASLYTLGGARVDAYDNVVVFKSNNSTSAPTSGTNGRGYFFIGDIDLTDATYSEGVGELDFSNLAEQQTFGGPSTPRVFAYPDRGGSVSVFAGNYNALTNTPALSNTDVGLSGVFYRVTVGATRDFGAGNIVLSVGDIISNDGTVWYKRAFGNNLQEVTDIGYTSTNPIELSNYLQSGLDVEVATVHQRYDMLRNPDGDVIFSYHYNYWNGSWQTSESLYLGVGAGALAKGLQNVGIGDNTLSQAENNEIVAIGHGAAENITSATGVFIGNAAGSNATTIGSGVYIGTGAGQFNDGLNVVFVGTSNPGIGNEGSYVTGIGSQTARYNKGTNVIAIDRRAGEYASADNSIYMLQNAGRFNNAQNSIGLGIDVLQNGQGLNVTVVGHNAWSGFIDSASTHVVADSDVNSINNSLTILAHGYTVGDRINLKYEGGSVSDITGVSVGEIVQFDVYSASELRVVDNSFGFFDQGSGNHTWRIGEQIENSSAFGYDADIEKSNQIVLGDRFVEEVKTAGALLPGTFTVATLPASPSQGARATVTDANATTFASTVAGGGANVVPVMYDGTNWIIG